MNHTDKLLEIHQLVSKALDITNYYAEFLRVFADRLLPKAYLILLSVNLYNAFDKSQQLILETNNLPENILGGIILIGENCSKQKGVYTVLVTLLIHKSLYPEQDVRFHQKKLPNGFSGRTIDTKYITPTLRSLGLTSMTETGWLTRSLEQKSPYSMDYQGEIGGKTIVGKEIKDAFLSILDFLEVKTKPANQQIIAQLLAIHLLKAVVELSRKETIVIPKIDDNKKSEIKINDIISALEEHFDCKTYTGKGTSKLPVIAIYAIYELIIKGVFWV